MNVSMAKENQFAYEAEPVRCFACSAIQKMLRNFTKDGGDDAGLMSRIIRAPSA